MPARQRSEGDYRSFPVRFGVRSSRDGPVRRSPLSRTRITEAGIGNGQDGSLLKPSRSARACVSPTIGKSALWIKDVSVVSFQGPYSMGVAYGGVYVLADRTNEAVLRSCMVRLGPDDVLANRCTRPLCDLSGPRPADSSRRRRRIARACRASVARE